MGDGLQRNELVGNGSDPGLLGSPIRFSNNTAVEVRRGRNCLNPEKSKRFRRGQTIRTLQIVINYGTDPAVGASFAWRVADWSGILALFGLVAIVGGLVLALRRRDYRIQQRHYGADFESKE